MCGIIGIAISEKSSLDNNTLKSIVSELLILSESRGKEASGVAIRSNSKIEIYKASIPASTLVETDTFSSIVDDSFIEDTDASDTPRIWSLIGHSRLVTNGHQSDNSNNQPVVGDQVVCVHNGIIVNVEDILKKNRGLKRTTDLDSEVIARIIEVNIKRGASLPAAIRDTFDKIHGEASIGVFLTQSDNLALATNTGSIFYTGDETIFLFASERAILSGLFEERKFIKIFEKYKIHQLTPCNGCIINLQTLKPTLFSLSPGSEQGPLVVQSENPTLKSISITVHPNDIPNGIDPPENFYVGDRDRIRQTIAEQPRPEELKRCTKCILPETFPFIEFDEEGVCNYCRNYVPTAFKGEDALKELVAPIKSNSTDQNCIVGFSGGRDSSFALHYVKRVLGLNPIATTYDWGLVTDLARRNCSRVCAGLHVEHIVVSADIEKKRRFVRKNLQAWLRRPDLGMVPLLMAGDKQFYYFANKLQRDTGIQIVFGGQNPFEKTDFKTGFCGIPPEYERGKGLLSGTKVRNKFKLLLYYLTQYIRNPAYINESLLDTLHAFYSTYILKDVYVNVYDYIPWVESEIIPLLRNTYDWEIAKDTTTTWRIGDGTAAFYNYIYYTIAGFSEIDTFRSNQIREGVITRDEALRLSWIENTPRLESLEWYAETIRFNLEDAIERIHAIPKLWAPPR